MKNRLPSIQNKQYRGSGTDTLLPRCPSFPHSALKMLDLSLGLCNNLAIKQSNVLADFQEDSGGICHIYPLIM